jgi:hypothetical protein
MKHSTRREKMKMTDKKDPVYYRDRINELIDMAKENGIDSLTAQSTSAYTESGKFYDVTVDTTNCRNFPYVDSFGYLREIDEENSNILVLTNDRNSSSVRSILHNTGGGIDISRERYPEYAFAECSSCGITQTKKTMFCINRRYYCEDCAKQFHPEAYAKLIAKKTGAKDVEYKA